MSETQTYTTNASVVIEAIMQELEGLKFLAFSIFHNGVAKGTRIFDIQNKTDIFLKICDVVNEEGALGAEIVTNSEEILAAFFNVPHYNVILKIDESIFKRLLNYFDPNTKEFEVLQEFYLSKEPEKSASELLKQTEKIRQSFFGGICNKLRGGFRKRLGNYFANLIEGTKTLNYEGE